MSGKGEQKVQVLMLNYEFPPLGGGASPVSYEIAQRLSEIDGIEIDVVTMHFKGLRRYDEINKDFRIHRVPCLRSKKEICHPWEQATYLVSGFFKCITLIMKNQYNVCYCHFIIPTGALAFLLKILFGLPYVITAHGSDVIDYNPRFKFAYPLLSIPWKTILNSAAKISTPSKFLRKKILRIHPNYDTRRIVVIPNGIQQNKFRPMKKERYILMVSRLFPNKGIQDFLKAIKTMDLYDWKVKIVGDGPYRATLEKMTRDYKLTGTVEFLGWIDNKSKELKELYGKARIFVMTSHFESMNMTILEALQAGCTVLTSNLEGIPEIIRKKTNTFPAGNSMLIQKNLKKIDSFNKNNIAKLPFNSTRIINKFLWKNVIPVYRSFLETSARKEP